MSQSIAAGILLYRYKDGMPEVFLVHPGGPYNAKKDDGVWSFPKGLVEEGEDLLEAAKREFKEETSFDAPKGQYTELGFVARPGKKVYAWAVEGDCNPAELKSNTCVINWPPRSGKQMEIPEVDRGDFFDVKTAKTKLLPYLAPVIELFIEKVK